MTTPPDTPPSDPPEVDPSAPVRQASPAPRRAGPWSGFLAGAAAIATGLVVAAIMDVDSPLNAVGSEFIDQTPKWLKNLAIDLFGTNDKLALRVGMVVVIGALSLVVGALARRRPLVGPAAMVVFGLVGAIVAAGRPNQSVAAAVPAMLGAVVGSAVIWYLVHLIRADDPARDVPSTPSRARNGFDRRRFVTASGAVAGTAIIATAAARKLENDRIDRIRSAAPDTLPEVSDPANTAGASDGSNDPALADSDVSSAAPAIPADATLSPVTPYVTPNDDFYLIDTALSVPRIRLDTWSMEIGGRVDTPITLTYDDLLALPQIERIITIACVSNEVGGDLIGNAVWQGVLLRDLLEQAGVQPEAEQVFGTSVDGWTCGFPLEAALDGRDAMIAIGMNGEPLPLQHGFPARMIVPGLYGYVSATKWLSRLDLTTWDEAVGYWIPRGWAREAPIKTQSRIDVPRRGDEVPRGVVPVAGIAWAQRRGVTKVEVRVDDGDWVEARLAPDVTVDSWRQWVYEWDTTGLDAGEHRLQVRASDATGETQTEEVSRPDPDGATGWHTRTVSVAS